MKVLAVLDADNTMWDIDGPIWDAAIARFDGDLLVLADGREVRLRPEVRSGLKALKGRGVLTGVASHNIDSPELGARAALASFGILGMFDAVVVRDSPDKNAMLREICAGLDVSPGQDKVFFTDDHERHVVEARRMGITAFHAGPSIQQFFDAVLEAAQG